MACGPCKDAVDCELIDDDGEEYEALNDLYRRLFEPRDDECCPANDAGGGSAYEHCGCGASAALTEKKATAAATGLLPDYCSDGVPDDTRLKRADRQLTALLRTRRDKDGGGGGSGSGTGGADAAEGDVKHLTANLPTFKSCKHTVPGAVNAALFGLDLEHWMTAGTGGDGRDDGVRRAAYDLAAAEAHCKHAGAVQAAERAVQVEPAGHLAEVAARFGAQSYASAGNASSVGQEAGDNTPVVVVAYVGNTGPADEADE